VSVGAASGDDIIPLEWGEAYEKHIEMMHADGMAQSTIRTHKSIIGLFVDWLTPKPGLTEEERKDEPGPNIEKTTELRRQHLQDYKLKRSREVKTITVSNQMDRVRVFLRNLERYGALPEGMHEFAISPDVEEEEERRSDWLEIERGNAIRDYLRKYEWGSEEHVYFELIWSSGMRLGAVQGLDVDDLELESGKIALRHRPETGTTLKNKHGGERKVTITETVTEAIEDFLARPDRPNEVKDEHGREPLFCNEDGTGRRGKQYLRDLMYSLTRPGQTEGGGCPHDKDPETCQAAQAKNSSYQCPSSKAPHAVRSGALTRMLKNDVPPWAVSRRVDCSEEVLEKHYNEMSEDEKADRLRDYFDDEYE